MGILLNYLGENKAVVRGIVRAMRGGIGGGRRSLASQSTPTHYATHTRKMKMQKIRSWTTSHRNLDKS